MACKPGRLPAVRRSWVLVVLVCGCDWLPAKEAEPATKPAASDGAAVAAAPASPSPEAAPAEKADAPALPTTKSLAEHGIALPSARGGGPVENSGPLIQITSERSVIPTGARVAGKSWVATDARTPFSAFAKALSEIGKDDGTAVVLVTRDGGVRGFEMRTKLVEKSKVPAPPLDLSVAVLEDGYRVAFARQQPGQPADTSARPTILLAKPGAPIDEPERWDTGALGSRISDFKTLFPRETSARLCAEATIPMGAVVAAAEALRGPECTAGTGAECRFPDLRVCTAPWIAPAPAVEKTPSSRDLRMRKIAVDGAMDPDIARRIVRVHRAKLRTCYEAALELDPSTQGDLTLKLELDGSGKVAKASVSATSLDNEALELCVEKAGKDWKFPRPTDGGDVVLEIPMAFGPKGSP